MCYWILKDMLETGVLRQLWSLSYGLLFDVDQNCGATNVYEYDSISQAVIQFPLVIFFKLCIFFPFFAIFLRPFSKETADKLMIPIVIFAILARPGAYSSLALGNAFISGRPMQNELWRVLFDAISLTLQLVVIVWQWNLTVYLYSFKLFYWLTSNCILLVTACIFVSQLRDQEKVKISYELLALTCILHAFLPNVMQIYRTIFV